jgi:hypothetical protein
MNFGNRFAALSTLIVAAAGLALLQATTARTADGCAGASAPVVASGAAQTSVLGTCPDGHQYWAMTLGIGDTLNVSIAPSDGAHIDFAAYGPDVGTTRRALCEHAATGSDTLSCLVPAAGRYVFVTTGPGSFTPIVRQTPDQAGRVAGTCDAGAAPIIRGGVTQYANSNLCEQSGAPQSWKIDLRAGDKLSVAITPFDLFGGSISLGVFGPNLGTTGSPLCARSYAGPGRLSCPIRRPGRYVLAAAHAGSFTPLVTHPTRTVATAPSSTTFGVAIRIAVAIGSNTPYPTGTCVVEEQSAWRWSAVLRVQTTTGACSVRFMASHRGSALLRVHFVGRSGWASSTSKAINVFVL